MKNIIFYLIFVVTLVSCSPGMNSMWEEDLSGAFKFHYGELGFPAIYRDSSSYKCIPVVVYDYSFNDNFIIATNKNFGVCNTDEGLGYSANCYDLLEKEELQYWVISHGLDEVFGPYSKEEYKRKRKELGVPKQLRLENTW